MWLRLRQIALVAPKLAPAVEEFQEILGLDVCFRDPGVGQFGLENALLPLGNQFVEIVAPVKEGTAGGRYLERRHGAGGYMFITQCNEHAPRRKRVEELGVRIVFHFETDDFLNMQMHPRDTGGTFFEIDEQLGEGAHELDGPWEPAGGDGWQTARRTDRVGGIVNAEIQVDDPEKTAARWAEIVELTVTRDANDNPFLQLDNAGARFVPCADGRPEGLGGLDLLANDRESIISAAKARNCLRDDDQIYLCGMRLNLL
ncbi:MAG: VOC family protein [Pseudomonadota bacterium]